MGKIEDALKIKHKKALDAISTLKTVLDEVENLDRDPGNTTEKMYAIFRDSLVQRFEYTFDLTWKCLSLYLEAEGRNLEIKSPKAIFRESLKAKLLSEDEVRLAIKMVDDRNLTTHGYDEELIERISESVPRYYQLIKTILKKVPVK